MQMIENTIKIKLSAQYEQILLCKLEKKHHNILMQEETSRAPRRVVFEKVGHISQDVFPCSFWYLWSGHFSHTVVVEL